MVVRQYEAADLPQWDAFVRASKNGHFLFERGYMDYHADRFADHSLLVYDDNERLIGLLPAHQRDQALVSHGGLTYGGLITDAAMKMPIMLEVFDQLRAYCGEHGISEIIYKAIPYLFHRLPADEDRYALYLNNADPIDRRVITVIDQRERLPFQQRRARGVKKAQKAGVRVGASDDLAGYWALLDDVLWATHQAHPVHSLSELKLLQERFPDNIKLYTACADSEMVAGVLIYESNCVARAQYIAASERGKAVGALDLLFDSLIYEVYADKRYFDFGTSHEPASGALNIGLITQKEEFGGRAVVCDTYRLNTTQDGS